MHKTGKFSLLPVHSLKGRTAVMMKLKQRWQNCEQSLRLLPSMNGADLQLRAVRNCNWFGAASSDNTSGISPCRTHWGAGYGVRLCSCDCYNGLSGIPLLRELLQAGCCKDIYYPRQSSEIGKEADVL
jgi:hypothetical protein